MAASSVAFLEHNRTFRPTKLRRNASAIAVLIVSTRRKEMMPLSIRPEKHHQPHSKNPCGSYYGSFQPIKTVSRGEHFCAPARFPEKESFLYGFFDVFATPRCNRLADKYFLIGCQVYLHGRQDTSRYSHMSRVLGLGFFRAWRRWQVRPCQQRPSLSHHYARYTRKPEALYFAPI